MLVVVIVEMFRSSSGKDVKDMTDFNFLILKTGKLDCFLKHFCKATITNTVQQDIL